MEGFQYETDHDQFLRIKRHGVTTLNDMRFVYNIETGKIDKDTLASMERYARFMESQGEYPSWWINEPAIYAPPSK